MKKRMISGVILCILLLGYTVFFGISTSKVVGDQVETIGFVDMSNAKVTEITDDNEIELIIRDLKINKWKRKLFWTLKLAPNVYLNINGQVIGLFEDENFAKLEGGKIKGYYKIPSGVYDNIVKYIRDREQS